MDLFFMLIMFSLMFAIAGYFVTFVIEGCSASEHMPLQQPALFIALVMIGISLCIMHCYTIIPYILYFVFGYFVSLYVFPNVKENKQIIDFDTFYVYFLIFDIIVFWPISLIWLFFKKINLDKFFKTPLSEWKKRNIK